MDSTPIKLPRVHAGETPGHIAPPVAPAAPIVLRPAEPLPLTASHHPNRPPRIHPGETAPSGDVVPLPPEPAIQKSPSNAEVVLVQYNLGGALPVFPVQGHSGVMYGQAVWNARTNRHEFRTTLNRWLEIHRDIADNMERKGCYWVALITPEFESAFVELRELLARSKRQGEKIAELETERAKMLEFLPAWPPAEGQAVSAPLIRPASNNQDLVKDEKRDLDSRINQLCDFLESPAFEGLSPEDQERLVRQTEAMTKYTSLLAERIAAFPPLPPAPHVPMTESPVTDPPTPFSDAAAGSGEPPVGLPPRPNETSPTSETPPTEETSPTGETSGTAAASGAAAVAESAVLKPGQHPGRVDLEKMPHPARLKLAKELGLKFSQAPAKVQLIDAILAHYATADKEKQADQPPAE